MDYELLYKTFNIPALSLEIASRIKRIAKHGTHQAKLTKIIQEGPAVKVEFTTPEGESILHSFRLDNPNTEMQFFELLIALHESIEGGYKSMKFEEIVERHKDESYQIYFGFDSDGFEICSIMGRVV